MQTDILLRPARQFEMKWPANFIAEDTEEFREEQVYTTEDSRLRLINNAWVSPDSVIYKNGLLVRQSLPAARYESYYKLRHLLKKMLKSKKVSLAANKNYLLVTDLWSGGHFHWFCDIFPKLLCIQNRTQEFVLLLPDSTYMRTIAMDSLSLWPLKFADIQFMRPDEFYKVKNLYFISRLSPSGRMHPELIKEVRDGFIKGKPRGRRRIYISRNKAAYRKVVNEDALVDRIKQYGFEALYAEDISLAEQINIFSSSEALMSVHGAGLTNCIFMPAGNKVIELRRKENGSSNVGYWHLADSLDHQYYYFNGQPDSDQPLVGRGCNLAIPLDDFEKRVLEKIK